MQRFLVAKAADYLLAEHDYVVANFRAKSTHGRVVGTFDHFGLSSTSTSPDTFMTESIQYKRKSGVRQWPEIV